MAKVGPPYKYTEAEVSEIAEKFRQYIDETDIPILAEFAYQNELTRPWMYDQSQLATLIKRCIDKKEAALERGTLKGELNPAMAIFSLKQMGWRDKQEVEHSGGTKNTVDLSGLSVEELRAYAKTKSSTT